MANILVVFFKQILFAHIEGPNYYVTFMDDIFPMFENEVEAAVFYQSLNTLH